jgi:phosphatidylserine/phosphatidylglycerophosphate/cardiolipin synthase-like enzyme
MVGRIARTLLIVVAWCISPLQAGAFGLAPVLPAQGTIQAAFSPWENIEGMIVAALGQAEHVILMQAYLLTGKPIVCALVNARHRGVEVKVIVDVGQLNKLPLAQKQLLVLRKAGIAVWGETRYANAHNKVIVIDAGQPGATLITGSYNFTWSAQHKNAENILIIRGDAPVIDGYAHNWQRHSNNAAVYD